MARAFRSFRSPLRTFLPQQRALALRYHCRLAVETMHPRFRFVAFDNLRTPYTVVLTVNSGYE